jgi:hypothetical protein
MRRVSTFPGTNPSSTLRSDHFRNDQQGTVPTKSLAGGASALPQTIVHIDPSRFHGWSHPKQNTDGDGNQQRIGQHAAVDADFVYAGNAWRMNGQHGAQSKKGDRNPKRTANGRQQDAFRQ